MRIVSGVPGAGKTTWLANDVRRVVKESGPQVAVLSFTRAAAAEVAGRDLPIHPSAVGTLHSLAYRALDRPELVVEHLGEWNEEHPGMQLSVDARSLSPEDLNAADAGMFGVTDTDKIMSKVEINRARRLPLPLWGGHEQAFWSEWQKWKQRNGLLDFTDLIENSLHVEAAPGNPQIAWVDEAQDLTVLELDLVRHWGQQMRELTIVGDPDQAIFTFKGASPEAFLDPSVLADHREVLDQSYRVPRAVAVIAQRWIEKLGDRRLPIVAKPRDADGLVRPANFDFTSEALIRDAIKQIEVGRSVVILATTSFGLNRVKDNLRLFGVPFHNPLRRSRPDWNPLHPARGVSTAQKILAYLALDERIFGEDAREWTGKDVKAWSSLLAKTGVFRRGAAAMIAGLPDRTLTYEEVASLFDSEEVLEKALEPNLSWLRAHLQSGYKQTAQYPLRIAEVFGPKTLAQTPLVSIGTVHSYKGGQGDVVYVSPDISFAALREANSPGLAGGDALIRLFYVAMTRAREELVLCAPTTRVNVHKQLTEGLE